MGNVGVCDAAHASTWEPYESDDAHLMESFGAGQQFPSNGLVSAYPGGANPPKSCAAVSAALSSRGAVVVGGFDNGGLGAWFCQQDEPTLSLYCPRLEVLQDDRICCIALDGSLIEEDGLEPRMNFPFAIGTDSGTSMLWEAQLECSRLKPQASWRSHAMAPGAGLSHAGVSSIALDGASLVTGGASSDACIWHLSPALNIADGGVHTRRRMQGAHGGAVTAVATSSGSGPTVTGGEDGIVCMWTPQKDVALPTHRGDSGSKQPVVALALDAKHQRVCSGSEDSMVRMWDIAVGRATRRFPHESKAVTGGLHPRRLRGVRSVAFDTAAAPTQLVSGGVDGSWRLWDVRQSQAEPVAQQPQAHQAAVASIAVSGTRILTAALDGHSSMWDVRRLAERKGFVGSGEHIIASVWDVYMLGLARPRKATTMRDATNHMSPRICKSRPTPRLTAGSGCVPLCPACPNGCGSEALENEPPDDLVIVPSRHMPLAY